MVFTSAMRAGAAGRKLVMRIPGLDRASLKKYPSLIPLHFFTLLGCTFATWYCYRLLSVKDTVLSNKTGLPAIKPTEKIQLFNPNVDFKNLKKPEARPDL